MIDILKLADAFYMRESFVGKEGFFTNTLRDIKNYLETGETGDGEIAVLKGYNDVAVKTEKGKEYNYFYLIESEPKKYKACESVDDLLEEYSFRICHGDKVLVNSATKTPSVSVRRLNREYYKEIIAFNYEEGLVYIDEHWISLRALFEDYVLLDGKPCGKEVRDEKRGRLRYKNGEIVN